MWRKCRLGGWRHDPPSLALAGAGRSVRGVAVGVGRVAGVAAVRSWRSSACAGCVVSVTCLSTQTVYAFTTSGGNTRTELTAFVPMNPQPADVSTCAYLVQSGDMLTNNPFAFSTSDALSIFYAAVPVLALAWGFRVVIQVLKQRDDYHE